MWRRRLFTKLFFTYSLIILFCLALVGGYLVVRERKTTRLQLEEHLGRLCTVLDERFAALLTAGTFAAVDSLASVLGPELGVRITVIAPDGVVVADSEESPARMENHRFRPEVQEAARGHVASSLRLSATVGRNFLYVAAPSQLVPGWVVRMALPFADYERRLRAGTNVLAGGALVAGLLAIVLGLIFTRRITRPLESMQRNLERLERGESGVRLDPMPNDEVGQLARTVNRVQEQLERNIDNLKGQHVQREAILASMVEGLLAVDHEDRVLLLNQAARHYLGIQARAVEGRPLVEGIRLPGLIEFVHAVRNSTAAMSRSLRLAEQGLWLELHGSPVRFDRAPGVGAVVVLNDTTRVRLLEQARTDFVANVSHELKTPITTMRGFLDTLLERGALEDPPTARRFLGILSKQTARLGAIVDDLLYLSRLEDEGAAIPMQSVNLGLVATASAGNVDWLAQERGVPLKLQLESQPVTIRGNAGLLTRAIDNLLQNAIKYSSPGAEVQLTVRSREQIAEVVVQDHGIGIAEEHLPRITERFYRVDTARSRELGGTGLGLAIVKHVVLTHGGRLGVESKVGAGSTFTLEFPLPQPS